jgi:1-acyl-sn-glycerol-3-phosphate acyltransferase
MAGDAHALAYTGYATRFARLARLVVHLMRGVLIAALLFPRSTDAQRRGHVRRWSRGLLTRLAIRLHVDDRALHAVREHRPRMIVANHVSWIDIFAIDAVMPSRFVAKSEVARWPVIGWLAARAGTLYLQRARRRDAARVNREVVSALETGEQVAVFPEGTTSDGSRLLKFHPSLLQAAVDGHAALVPVAVSYWRADGTRCTEVAYDGRWTLWDTLRRALRLQRIDCTLSILPALPPPADRRAAAHLAHDAIADALADVSRSRSDRAGGPRGAAR